MVNFGSQMHLKVVQHTKRQIEKTVHRFRAMLWRETGPQVLDGLKVNYPASSFAHEGTCERILMQMNKRSRVASHSL